MNDRKPSAAIEQEGFSLNTVIVANGDIKDRQSARERLQEADLVVAANGGTLHCLELNIQPDIVVGDLDSLEADTLQQLKDSHTEVIEHPSRKDATDLELALELAVERGGTRLAILGAVGGRWDQTLANFHLVSSSRWQEQRLEVVDGPQSVYPIHPGSEFELHGETGDLVSLIPFGGDAAGVHSHGLEYALSDETLIHGKSRGISNVLMASPARIWLHSGTLLCLIIHGGEEQLMKNGGN